MSAAPTYDRLLSHVRPRCLLGLTATPERADGRPIVHWFDDRMAAELRLWHALDQQLLCPFQYFGKTVVAALDYRRLRSAEGPLKLLFVAHRKEILDQSLATFRVVLKDGAFGEHPSQALSVV